MNITGGPDLSLAEASEATGFITRAAHPEANVIYGIVTNEDLRRAVKVTVIATGFERDSRDGDSAPRLGAAAAIDARGQSGNGNTAGGTASVDAHRVGVGDFMRRMWTARAEKQ